MHAKARRMREAFHKFAHRTADALGSPWAFAMGLLACLAWAATGPIFGYSDTWQLVINTSTTVATFLAVFLIQNTQNRDAKALHLKLDELLRAEQAARTGLVGLERLTDEELDRLDAEFERVRSRYASQRPGRGKRRPPRKTAGSPDGEDEGP
jgi:low affinity Fe/Cu permease